jgi:hypothetical protein
LPINVQNEPAAFAYFFIFQAKGNCLKALKLAFFNGVFDDSVIKKVVVHSPTHQSPEAIQKFLVQQKDLELLYRIVANSRFMMSFWTIDLQVAHYESMLRRVPNVLTPPSSPSSRRAVHTITPNLNLAVMLCCHPAIYEKEILNRLSRKMYIVENPNALVLQLSKKPYDEYIQWVLENTAGIDVTCVLSSLVSRGSPSTLNLVLKYVNVENRSRVMSQLVPLAVIRGVYSIVKLIGEHGGVFSDPRLLNVYYVPGNGGTQLLEYLVSRCNNLSAIDEAILNYINIMHPNLHHVADGVLHK